MENITFKHIYKAGQPVLENELYIHVHNPEMLLQYDSNFIKFKRMPNVEEFKAAEKYLRDFHQKFNQQHVRFYFSENEKISQELESYLKTEASFSIGFLELYAVEPSKFPAVNVNVDIDVRVVAEDILDSFLELQYKQDSVFGEAFAEQKQQQHLRNYKNDKFIQVMAFYKGVPAGSVDVILSEDTAEIDGLVVQEAFQRKGIGSQLQRYVMNEFNDRIVILVADGEDTPKEMYRKQNYQYLGFQYEALKVYE
jgi:ribosomal protein S18 acetylase RimI-like enzyme